MKKTAAVRLFIIYVGCVLGLIVGIGVANLLSLPSVLYPLAAISCSAATGVLLGRFPFLFHIVCWLLVFPFAFEDQFFQKKGD